MVHSVSDIPLVSMVKDTDGPTVWFDGNTEQVPPKGGLFSMVKDTEG